MSITIFYFNLKIMRILFLGYSDILKKKILPSLYKDKNFICEIASRRKLNNNFFSKSFNNYDSAIKYTKSKLIYVSLINSLHYKYCKKALLSDKHVIVDKPLSQNSKKNIELLNIAKKKKLLLAEAVVFTFNKRFKKFYSSIDFKKSLKINVCFSIPELNKRNFRNFKSKGGGCYNDMSVYAFKCIDLFFKKDLKKKIYFKKKDLNNLSENFQIKIKDGNFLLKCDFRFNSKYKNFIKIQNNKNILYLPMAFSQPLNSETYYINNGLKKKFKVENSFHKFLINIKDTIKKKKNLINFIMKSKNYQK